MGYSQNDSRWSGDKLGTSTYWTMGMAGCLVTAGANVLRAFGHDITPGDLNRLATSRGLINSNGDVTRWDWLSVLFPDVCKYVEHVEWGTVAAPLSYFDVRNDVNTEIIEMIDDSPAPGMQTHFMRVIGWDGGTDVLVDDSWDGIRKGTNAYGARWYPAVHAASIIYNATKYIRVVPTPPVTPTPTPPVVPPPVVTPPVTPPADPTPPVEPPADPPIETPPATPPAEKPIEPTPPKVIVPDPSDYFRLWELFVAFCKRLWKSIFKK